MTFPVPPSVRPFNSRVLPDQSCLAVSETGDHVFLSTEEIERLETSLNEIPEKRIAELMSKNFLSSNVTGAGTQRLIRSRQAARQATGQDSPSLHIIVPTLQCAHSCKYCQVSRSLNDTGHTMSLPALESVCRSMFDSSSPTLTVEFQGGDPLLRFDLVRHAILRISELNQREQRNIRFVIASTLHQLTREMCDFFKEHAAVLSTSVDGPKELHNKNRPTPTRDSYERTLEGIALARELMGAHSVSALMTTTRESLLHPEAIVDEYVRLGFNEIFLRPLSSYGFAKRNQAILGYSPEAFTEFYRRALNRVLEWCRKGVVIREVYASILLNKMLSTFDSGYVDLQSPSGSGRSVLVYNYDGYMYPSDEARMLAETGDVSLRLGPIGASLNDLQASSVQLAINSASTVTEIDDCKTCVYNKFCAPNPVDAQAQYSNMFKEPTSTEHCFRHRQLFDEMYVRLKNADEFELDLFHSWAQPSPTVE
jgi:His-Xaa-Ser system radical SAM maturase HxsB